MRNVWIIAWREFRQFFISPLAYAVALVMLLILGYFFSRYAFFGLQTGQVADANFVVPLLTLLLIIAIPAITMRLLADEQRMGTLELLLTAPVRDWELVLGKWLGAFCFMLILLALTWIYPLILNRFTDPGIDQGMLLTTYVGLVVMVGAMLALGVFVSALFASPVVAFLVALGLLLILWIIGGSGGSTSLASQVFGYLGMSDHFYENLFRGILDLGDVVYFLSLTALGLFLSAQVIESRRWR